MKDKKNEKEKRPKEEGGEEKRSKDVNVIKVVSLGEGQSVQVASGAVILPSSSHGQLPMLDWRTAANVVRVKESSSTNIARINKVLKKAEDMECLRNGIGSRGGHIARQLGAPGPTNGHTPIKDSDRLHVSSEAKMSEEDMLSALKGGRRRPFAPPEWDHNHVEGKSLSYKFAPPHIERDPLF